MRITIIVVNEKDEQLDLLNVEHVIIIDDIQYAVVQSDEEQTFCKIVKEYDGSMRLADILDDDEFERVQNAFMISMAAH